MKNETQVSAVDVFSFRLFEKATSMSFSPVVFIFFLIFYINRNLNYYINRNLYFLSTQPIYSDLFEFLYLYLKC